MDLQGGIKASSEFSWISPRYLRTIEIYGDSGMIFGDYLNQEVIFYENDDYDNPSPDKDTFFRHGLVKSGKVIKYPMYKEEPLLLELKNFVFALMGREEILVKPGDAKQALENAYQI
jgi:predicted dehydrogenase